MWEGRGKISARERAVGGWNPRPVDLAALLLSGGRSRHISGSVLVDVIVPVPCGSFELNLAVTPCKGRPGCPRLVSVLSF